MDTQIHLQDTSSPPRSTDVAQPEPELEAPILVLRSENETRAESGGSHLGVPRDGHATSATAGVPRTGESTAHLAEPVTLLPDPDGTVQPAGSRGRIDAAAVVRAARPIPESDPDAAAAVRGEATDPPGRANHAPPDIAGPTTPGATMNTTRTAQDGFHIPPTREVAFHSVRGHWSATPEAGDDRDPHSVASTAALNDASRGRLSQHVVARRAESASDERVSHVIDALRASALESSDISIQPGETGWRRRLVAWFRPARHTGVPASECAHVWQPGRDEGQRPVMRCDRCSALDATPQAEPADPAQLPRPFRTTAGPLWEPVGRGTQSVSPLLDHAALLHRTYRRRSSEGGADQSA